MVLVDHPPPRIALVPWVCERIKDNGYRCGKILMELAEIDRGTIRKKCDCGAWWLWSDGKARQLARDERA